MALDFECDEKQEEKSIRFPVANLKYHHHVVYKREYEWMIDFFFKKNLCHRKWKIFCFLLGFSLSLSLFLPPSFPICRKKPLYAKLFRKQKEATTIKTACVIRIFVVVVFCLSLRDSKVFANDRISLQTIYGIIGWTICSHHWPTMNLDSSTLASSGRWLKIQSLEYLPTCNLTGSTLLHRVTLIWFNRILLNWLCGVHRVVCCCYDLFFILLCSIYFIHVIIRRHLKSSCNVHWANANLNNETS